MSSACGRVFSVLARQLAYQSHWPRYHVSTLEMRPHILAFKVFSNFQNRREQRLDLALFSILSIPNSNANQFILHFQDGVEFSTPRIHNPIYEIADGCFSGNDVYDFNNNRLNQPLFSNKAAPAHDHHQHSSLLIALLALACCHVFNVFIV